MTTEPAEPHGRRIEQGRELAEQAAALLNQLDALGLGGTEGRVFISEIGELRRHPSAGWIITDR
ncbi:hypothetical protein ACFYWP_36840 [Actinacidiphila glaucinigra]|uniref:hypothetical protein n=1 Tax=Actinacidiphila glaucinigra TaxID=235986 RepID=UPI0036CA3DBE